MHQICLLLWLTRESLEICAQKPSTNFKKRDLSHPNLGDAFDAIVGPVVTCVFLGYFIADLCQYLVSSTWYLVHSSVIIFLSTVVSFWFELSQFGLWISIL